MLYAKPPSYSTFHPFGCLVFPYLRDYAHHKLTLRNHPCVFLGYNTSHHGFHCLDRSINHIFISKHTVFDENNYPFSATNYSSPLFNLSIHAFLEPFSSITTASKVHLSQQHNSLSLSCPSCLVNTSLSFVSHFALQDSIIVLYL